MKKFFVLVVLLICLCDVFAQNQNNQWRFGYNSGIDFNTSPPSAVSTSQIFATEGIASIADANSGALLFYTDGVTVWNANNAVMPNGTGLFGGVPGQLSSACAAVIIPKPFTPNVYYVVTKDEQGGGKGLCYSTVDMTLNGGLGDVVASEKNVFLYETESETVHVVPTNDFNGYWIITYDSPDATLGSRFVAIKLDQCGFASTPVFSSFPTIETDTAYMKVNKQFTKLAITAPNGSDSKVRMFDFNNSTGVLSNLIEWNYNGPLTYFSGVEFSPDGTKLYVCGALFIKQFDVSTANGAAIESSSFQLPFLPSFSPLSNLQLGPDNKIYVSSSNVSVINFPNLSGAACNYVANAIPEQVGQAISTFPQLVNLINPNPPGITANSIVSSGNCLGFASTFTLQNTTGVTSVTWDFGEPASGVQNTAIGFNVQHSYLSSGNFLVTAVVSYGCVNQTITASISVNAATAISATPRTICQGSTAVELPTIFPNSNITGTWNPPQINSNVSGTTNYVFTVNPGQCTTSSSVTLAVTVLQDIVPTFNTPAPFCAGSQPPVLPTISTNGITGTWSPATVSNTSSGTYTFTPSTDECAEVTSLTVSVTPAVIPTFSFETTICSTTDEVPGLPSVSNNGISGIWTPSAININAAAEYIFTPDQDQCADSITVEITIENLQEATVIQGCDGGSYKLSVQDPITNYQYEWFNNSNTSLGTTSAITIQNSGEYFLEISNGLCETTIPVTVNTVSCNVQIPKGISPNGDGANDSFDLSQFNVARLEVFNRYGLKVFSANNYIDQWNGQSDQGHDLPTGTYFYLIDLDSGESKTGWVYINR
ncbi:gliding motility-associated C-terminal domain-containing protein [Flavobacterium sp.]|uniref:T9SS type B sorting domain-containing protein n=1 Tax=Flavobacterium sp. TaxID=239 RepID=UPI00262E25A7|nr:gliding motility-associated C-terminal domain-containing protein [Flavobacterium sp.]